MLVEPHRIVRRAVLRVGPPREQTQGLGRARERVGRRVRAKLPPAALAARLAGALEQRPLENHRAMQDFAEPSVAAV